MLVFGVNSYFTIPHKIGALLFDQQGAQLFVTVLINGPTGSQTIAAPQLIVSALLWASTTILIRTWGG